MYLVIHYALFFLVQIMKAELFAFHFKKLDRAVIGSDRNLY